MIKIFKPNVVKPKIAERIRAIFENEKTNHQKIDDKKVSLLMHESVTQYFFIILALFPTRRCKWWIQFFSDNWKKNIEIIRLYHFYGEKFWFISQSHAIFVCRKIEQFHEKTWEISLFRHFQLICTEILKKSIYKSFKWLNIFKWKKIFWKIPSSYTVKTLFRQTFNFPIYYCPID